MYDDRNAELDELQRQHERDDQRAAALTRQVEALAQADSEGQLVATRTLDDAVAPDAAFLSDPIRHEEEVLLPAAQRDLLPQD